MVILERSGGERPSITGGLCFNFFHTKQNETNENNKHLDSPTKYFIVHKLLLLLFIFEVPHSWNFVVHTHIPLQTTKTRLS